MWDQPVDIGLGLTDFSQGGTRGIFQHTDCELEHRLAIHLKQRVAQHIATGHMPRHTQNIHMFAIGVQVAGQNARCFRRFQHHGAGTVTKQHAGGAVFEIKNTREHFRPNNQCLVRCTGLDHAVRNGQRKNESTANRLYVKSRTTIGAQFVLQNAGCGRKHHVGGGRGNNNEVYVLRHTSSRSQCVFCGFVAQIATKNPRVGKVARFDTRALNNPLIGRLHALTGQLGHQIGIGQSPRGQVTSGACDSRISSHEGFVVRSGAACAMRA